MTSDDLTDKQLQRYARHILLDDVGPEGQAQLLSSHVLIVGAGGLGCAAAQYLACSGVGKLTLADADQVELSNLQRQILHRKTSIGQAKVDSAQRSLHDINESCRVNTLAERLDSNRLDQLLQPQAGQTPIQVVLDCSDNMATRQAVNAACVRHGVGLVLGAALGMDGQLFVRPAHSTGPCYACIFPEDQAHEEQHCATYGVLAPLVGWVGTLQALATLQLLLQRFNANHAELHCLDARTLHVQRIRLDRQSACAVCATP